MVNTPARPASIPKILSRPFWLALLLLSLAGCQTPEMKKSPAPTAGQAGAKPLRTAAFSSSEKRPTPTAQPVVPAQTAVRPVAQQNVSLPAPAAQVKKRPVDLPAEISNWRVTRLSAREWSLTPLRRAGLSDSPPSLMEDAIITSGIHARLPSAGGQRGPAWKYTCNSGSVALSSAELTVNQAVAALQAVLSLDKVSEVRLTTTLR